MVRPRKAVLLSLALVTSQVALGSEYKSGEVIVKYKDGQLRTRSSMDALYNSAGVAKVRRYSNVMRGIEQLILHDNMTVDEALNQLRKNKTVEYAQPNYILHALPIAVNQVGGAEANLRHRNGVPCWFPGIPFPPGCEDSPVVTDPSKRPDLNPPPAEVEPPVVDPDLSKTYGLEKVQATAAWAIHKGSKDFIVADIDTGIDYNHEDLAGNVWRNPNPSEQKDIVGFDFVHNDGLPFDDNNHGSHTAGSIGAVGGNGIGISGVAQRVSIMALKFLSGDGSGTSADAIRAIDYAINHGAKVLSNSWGGKQDPDNQALFDAIERAKSKNVLFIAAAGNDGADNDGSDASYPAAFNNDNLISVAATDSGDSLAYFSNYGKKTTHVAAPGVNVYSTVPGNKYESLSGTSMACPHVAGAAALVWSKHPEWDYKKVKEVLMKSVDLLPGLAEKTVTGGRINVLKALSSME